MKSRDIALLVLAFGCMHWACDSAPGGKKVELVSQIDSASYALGLDMGRHIKTLDMEINTDILFAAINDRLSGAEPKLTEEEISTIMKEMGKRQREKMAEERNAAAEKNLEEGKQFLEENKAQLGVQSTKSGLQYKVLKKSDGPKPKATDRVTVHYRGTLLDGTEFDSSHKRGKPVTFALNRVIPGWTEGVQLMNTGSTYRFWIPSDLAYGKRGSPPKIGPNATLIFDVELISIEK